MVLDEDQPLIGQPITASVDDPDNNVAVRHLEMGEGDFYCSKRHLDGHPPRHGQYLYPQGR